MAARFVGGTSATCRHPHLLASSLELNTYLTYLTSGGGGRYAYHRKHSQRSRVKLRWLGVEPYAVVRRDMIHGNWQVRFCSADSGSPAAPRNVDPKSARF